MATFFQSPRNSPSNFSDENEENKKCFVQTTFDNFNYNQKENCASNMNTHSKKNEHLKSYRQMEIRPFCRVTQKLPEQPKRSALGDITNMKNFNDSPKSRLAIFRKNNNNNKLGLRQNSSRKRTINKCEDENDEKDDEQKRCKNAVSKYVYNHVDNSSIPQSVRPLLRVHSCSLLESSWQSDKDSPERFDAFTLVTVAKPQIPNGAFVSISALTLKQLLESMTEKDFQEKFILIDCRYPFEYNGGHIKTAINMFDTTKICDTFFPENHTQFLEINSKIPIFYCEYSQKRGPTMAMELRRQDRVRNENHYPNIDYKEIYILDCGYKNFYEKEQYTDLCDPSNYIPMIHPDYNNELIKYKSHKKFSKMSYNTENINDIEASQRKLSFDLESSPVSIFRNTRERNMALKEMDRQIIKKIDFKMSNDSIVMETSETSIFNEISPLSIESDDCEIETTVSPNMEHNFSMMCVRTPSKISPSTSNSFTELNNQENVQLKLDSVKEESENFFDEEIVTTLENSGVNLSPFTVYSQRSLFYRDVKRALTSTPLL